MRQGRDRATGGAAAADLRRRKHSKYKRRSYKPRSSWLNSVWKRPLTVVATLAAVALLAGAAEAAKAVSR